MIEFDTFYVRKAQEIVLPLNEHIKTDEWSVKSKKRQTSFLFSRFDYV